jgi:hypothetical protein
MRLAVHDLAVTCLSVNTQLFKLVQTFGMASNSFSSIHSHLKRRQSVGWASCPMLKHKKHGHLPFNVKGTTNGNIGTTGSASMLQP